MHPGTKEFKEFLSENEGQNFTDEEIYSMVEFWNKTGALMCMAFEKNANYVLITKEDAIKFRDELAAIRITP